MPSVQELADYYKSLSDSELYDIYLNIDDFSEEAKLALDIVLNYKGGLKVLEERLAKQTEKAIEILRIETEVVKMADNGFELNNIKFNILSSIIDKTQVYDIIDYTFSNIELHRNDIKVKPRTIIGSLLGAIIAGTIGGVIWGVQLMYSGRIFVIFGLGLIMLSYGVIKLFTKQSKNNWLVLTMTIMSVVYSIIFGFIIYHVFGNQRT